jgi:hypothetical protein
MGRGRPIAALALWLVSGCGAGWRQEELSPVQELPARQQVQVWQGRGSQVLHSVLVSPDSVTGVPFHLPPECDSCRIAVARNTVDSMRLGNRERGALKSFGAGYVALGVAALLLYVSVDSD